MRAYFWKYDTNKSGQLDYRELQLAVRELQGAMFDLMEYQSIQQRYDRDGNGRIGPAEFSKILNGLKLEGRLPRYGLPETLPAGRGRE